MKTIYALHDSRAAAYRNLHVEENPANAWRAFAEEVRNPNSMISRYPEDFELVAVGEFDDAVGLVVPYENPQLVVAATEIVRRNAQARVVNGEAAHA